MERGDMNLSDTNLKHTNDTNSDTNTMEHANDTNDNGKKNWVLVIGVGVLLVAITILSLYILNIYPFGQKESVNTSEELPNDPTIDVELYESVELEPKELLLTRLPLNPQFMPEEADVVLNQGQDNNYTSFWNTESATASANFIAVDSAMSHLLLAFPFIHKELISIDSAGEIASKYISTNPKGEWKCVSTQSGSQYCENFWTSSAINIGIGIQSPEPGLDPNLYSLIYCQSTVDSIFHSWNSCNAQYKDTGIE
jgi:hypothetical protein